MISRYVFGFKHISFSLMSHKISFCLYLERILFTHSVVKRVMKMQKRGDLKVVEMNFEYFVKKRNCNEFR